MDNLKAGDYIVNADGSAREEVLAVLGKIIFTRLVRKDGTSGPAMGPTLIEDAITYGFKKEVEA